MQTTQPEQQDQVVSFDDEPLILVDERDTILGYRSKAEAHDGPGLLHRAFSVFLFNSRGETLLQQRASEKRLWPGYWSNTCCSHPRRGEATESAADRRVYEELGLRAPLRYTFKFVYQARYGDAGSEHELCSVFVGHTDAIASYNRTEIAATRFIASEALDADLENNPDAYTPWLKLEWPRLRREHWQLVQGLYASSTS